METSWSAWSTTSICCNLALKARVRSKAGFAVQEVLYVKHGSPGEGECHSQEVMGLIRSLPWRFWYSTKSISYCQHGQGEHTPPEFNPVYP